MRPSTQVYFEAANRCTVLVEAWYAPSWMRRLRDFWAELLYHIKLPWIRTISQRASSTGHLHPFLRAFSSFSLRNRRNPDHARSPALEILRLRYQSGDLQATVIRLLRTSIRHH